MQRKPMPQMGGDDSMGGGMPGPPGGGVGRRGGNPAQGQMPSSIPAQFVPPMPQQPAPPLPSPMSYDESAKSGDQSGYGAGGGGNMAGGMGGGLDIASILKQLGGQKYGG